MTCYNCCITPAVILGAWQLLAICNWLQCPTVSHFAKFVAIFWQKKWISWIQAYNVINNYMICLTTIHYYQNSRLSCDHKLRIPCNVRKGRSSH